VVSPGRSRAALCCAIHSQSDCPQEAFRHPGQAAGAGERLPTGRASGGSQGLEAALGICTELSRDAAGVIPKTTCDGRDQALTQSLATAFERRVWGHQPGPSGGEHRRDTGRHRRGQLAISHIPMMTCGKTAT
jgi:hypothetical protein